MEKEIMKKRDKSIDLGKTPKSKDLRVLLSILEVSETKASAFGITMNEAYCEIIEEMYEKQLYIPELPVKS
jgi:hypothetical protein